MEFYTLCERKKERNKTKKEKKQPLFPYIHTYTYIHTYIKPHFISNLRVAKKRLVSPFTACKD